VFGGWFSHSPMWDCGIFDQVSFSVCFFFFFLVGLDVMQEERHHRFIDILHSSGLVMRKKRQIRGR